jgi:hypothetical protein
MDASRVIKIIQDVKPEALPMPLRKNYYKEPYKPDDSFFYDSSKL